MTGRADFLVEKLRPALSGRAEILEGYLFGSQARGEARRHSDVDVAVFIDESRAPAAPFGYEAELATERVHAYLEVDLGQVHRLLNERLDDFARFAALVERYVQAR